LRDHPHSKGEKQKVIALIMRKRQKKRLRPARAEVSNKKSKEATRKVLFKTNQGWEQKMKKKKGLGKKKWTSAQTTNRGCVKQTKKAAIQ